MKRETIIKVAPSVVIAALSTHVMSVNQAFRSDYGVVVTSPHFPSS
jgi:hypothetical protein